MDIIIDEVISVLPEGGPVCSVTDVLRKRASLGTGTQGGAMRAAGQQGRHGPLQLQAKESHNHATPRNTFGRKQGTQGLSQPSKGSHAACNLSLRLPATTT